jgi:polypeptide N-acetylgalactosaminyltransferase
MAVRKDYFDDIGWFDEGLNVWGGENIELGFRAWMCHGRVATITCSRVGHVFKEFPYQFDGNKEEIVQKNLIRVAETWMDGWKKYFYATTRIYPFKRFELNESEKKSLADRIQQRKDMKCKSFEWFMYNIMPEMDIPPMDAKYFGEITSTKSQACWEVQDDFAITMTYFCFFHKIIPFNNFALTSDGMLRYREKCVRISPPNPILRVGECAQTQEEKDRNGIWEFKNKGEVWGMMKVKRKKDDGVWERFCVTQVTNVLDAHKGEQMPQIGGECNDDNEFQVYSWTYGLDWSQVPQSSLTKYRT